MSLESIITEAVRSSPEGLTRDELLAQVRRHDTEQNIMRMASRMLAGNRLQYNSAGRYTCPPPKSTAAASTPALKAPAAAAKVEAASERKKPLTEADGRKRPTRERILEFVGSGRHTAKNIMDGLDLSEPSVSNYLRALMKEGLVAKVRNPANLKAPLYLLTNAPPASDAAALITPTASAAAIQTLQERLAAAANNAQLAMQQFHAALADLQQQAAELGIKI